jgi:hypothetical protein
MGFGISAGAAMASGGGKHAQGWERGFAALSKFRGRKGHCCPPRNHLEGKFKLGQWVITQRYLKNDLSVERKKGHVRDRIHCQERGHISVKGIAYPVATYQVVDAYENLGTERLFMHEERPNLRLDLNLDAMSASDRGHAATVLREALNRLSALDQASAPGPHEAKQVAFAQDRPPGTE